MAAVTTLAVTTAATAYSINEQRSARKDQERAQATAAQQAEVAAQDQEQASQRSLEYTLEAQNDAIQGIQDAYSSARSRLLNPNLDPTRDISSFTSAVDGLDAYKRSIDGGYSDGITDLVSNASMGATNNPALMTDGDIVQNEIARLAGIEGQKAVPFVGQELLAEGQAGLGAVSDVANINARQANQIGDLRNQAQAALSSTYMGNAPQLAQLSNSANNARSLTSQAGMLSNIASQNIGTADKEAAAQGIGYLAGQLNRLSD